MEDLQEYTRMGREEYFIRTAHLTASRGTCGRLKVGVIAVRDKHIIATGYNGALPKEQHCNNKICDMDSHCTRTVHAEQNLIYFAARAGISLDGATVYVTHSPCPVCARALIMAGIVKVSYAKQFRDTTGLDVLRDNNVEVENLSHEEAKTNHL